MKIYTRGGDDGTTSLLGGLRVPKAALVVELNGTLDEAQAFLGLARSTCERHGWLDEILVSLEHDLWVVMGQLAVGPGSSSALAASVPIVTTDMIERLEGAIDHAIDQLDLDHRFAVPGDNHCSATLDVARAVVRRAERVATRLEECPSLVLAYLNRLSDLCWALARNSEQVHEVQRRGDPKAVDPKAGDPKAGDPKAVVRAPVDRGAPGTRAEEDGPVHKRSGSRVEREQT